MVKRKCLEEKASVEQNLMRIEKDIKNLREFFLVVLPIISKGGFSNGYESKNN